jgi:uncharacterized RDD family membrane protein YckC
MSESTPTLSFASYGKRSIAFLIDAVIGIVISALLLLYLVLPAIVPDVQERAQNFMELSNIASNPESSTQESEEALQNMYEVIAPIMLPANIGLLVLLALYFSLGEILSKGASLGKQLFRLRVYSLRTREPVTSQTSIARSLIKTCCIVLFPIGSLGFVFLIGIALLPMFTRNRQAFHDLLTKSVVMDESGMWVKLAPASPPNA